MLLMLQLEFPICSDEGGKTAHSQTKPQPPSWKAMIENLAPLLSKHLRKCSLLPKTNPGVLAIRHSRYDSTQSDDAKSFTTARNEGGSDKSVDRQPACSGHWGSMVHDGFGLDLRTTNVGCQDREWKTEDWRQKEGSSH
ncbi:hypothetical protein JTB14_002308 [Gonioctena quinquepunctata]|nr:hypothetical protein JTB14_002308 [Gonioctena quinquepunctata]